METGAGDLSHKEAKIRKGLHVDFTIKGRGGARTTGPNASSASSGLSLSRRGWSRCSPAHRIFQEIQRITY